MVGEKIKSLRAEKGLTMRELAKKADIDASMISDYEQNKVTPRYQAIVKLAKAFGIKKEELIGNEPLIDNSFDPKLFNQLVKQLPDLDDKAKTSLIPIFLYYTEQKKKQESLLKALK